MVARGAEAGTSGTRETPVLMPSSTVGYFGAKPNYAPAREASARKGTAAMVMTSWVRKGGRSGRS